MLDTSERHSAGRNRASFRSSADSQKPEGPLLLASDHHAHHSAALGQAGAVTVYRTRQPNGVSTNGPLVAAASMPRYAIRFACI